MRVETNKYKKQMDFLMKNKAEIKADFKDYYEWCSDKILYEELYGYFTDHISVKMELQANEKAKDDLLSESEGILDEIYDQWNNEYFVGKDELDKVIFIDFGRRIVRDEL